jgi:hypothetical protein
MTLGESRDHDIFFRRLLEDFESPNLNYIPVFLCPDPRAVLSFNYDSSSGCHCYLVVNRLHQWIDHPGLRADRLETRFAAWRELFARDAKRLPVDFRTRARITSLFSQPP